jgi:hypothetical protein
VRKLNKGHVEGKDIILQNTALLTMRKEKVQREGDTGAGAKKQNN